MTSPHHPWFSEEPPFGAIALVASAGGVTVLQQILDGIPEYFLVPIIVLVHRRERQPGLDILADILSRHSKLPVTVAQAGERLSPGTVYVAPPNQHLQIVNQQFVVTIPLHNRHVRPSANLLLQSIAHEMGSRAIAVVLTGSLNDGAVGVNKIKAAGGVVFVQNPTTAFSPGMPEAAILTGCTDFVLQPSEIAAALTTMTMIPGATSLFCSSAKRATESKPSQN